MEGVISIDIMPNGFTEPIEWSVSRRLVLLQSWVVGWHMARIFHIIPSTQMEMDLEHLSPYNLEEHETCLCDAPWSDMWYTIRAHA
jgi:hypothetical protein